MTIKILRMWSFEGSLLLPAVFAVLLSLTAGKLLQKAPGVDVECDIVQVTECPVTCGGGFQLMKYACTNQQEHCGCPKNPIYYQCNNRPCLGKNSTLLDLFYDEENKQQEDNGVEYVEESEEAAPIKTKNE